MLYLDIIISELFLAGIKQLDFVRIQSPSPQRRKSESFLQAQSAKCYQIAKILLCCSQKKIRQANRNEEGTKQRNGECEATPELKKGRNRSEEIEHTGLN